MYFPFRLPGFSLGIARLLGWSISFGLVACGGGGGDGHDSVRDTASPGPIGPVGAPGADGKNGTNGTDGINGTNGINGVNGAGILTGAGAPTVDIGANGDLYFDSASTMLYGPKADSGWPASGVSLKGAQGDKGDPGSTGSNPAVFFSRFTVRPGGVDRGAFYVPVSADRDAAPAAGYALNATTMPLSCAITSLYAGGTIVEEPFDPYTIDADSTSIDVTLFKNEAETSLRAALDLNIGKPSATVSGIDSASASAVTVMPGDTIAWRVTPTSPYVSVAMNVSLICR